MYCGLYGTCHRTLTESYGAQCAGSLRCIHIPFHSVEEYHIDWIQKRSIFDVMTCSCNTDRSMRWMRLTFFLWRTNPAASHTRTGSVGGRVLSSHPLEHCFLFTTNNPVFSQKTRCYNAIGYIVHNAHNLPVRTSSEEASIHTRGKAKKIHLSHLASWLSSP